MMFFGLGFVCFALPLLLIVVGLVWLWMGGKLFDVVFQCG